MEPTSPGEAEPEQASEDDSTTEECTSPPYANSSFQATEAESVTIATQETSNQNDKTNNAKIQIPPLQLQRITSQQSAPIQTITSQQPTPRVVPPPSWMPPSIVSSVTTFYSAPSQRESSEPMIDAQRQQNAESTSSQAIGGNPESEQFWQEYTQLCSRSMNDILTDLENHSIRSKHVQEELK